MLSRRSSHQKLSAIAILYTVDLVKFCACYQHENIISFRTPIIAGDKGIPLLAQWSRKEEELRAAEHAQTLKMLGIEPI